MLNVVFLPLSEMSREAHNNGVIPKFCGKLPFFQGEGGLVAICTVVSDRDRINAEQLFISYQPEAKPLIEHEIYFKFNQFISVKNAPPQQLVIINP